MFGSLFASREPALKPMQMTHAARVVAVIEETDEDDALEAEQGFLKGALDGMFVLMKDRQVMGVTGYALDEKVPDVVWPSWTYLTGSDTGGGPGGFMLNDLPGRLKDWGIRKIFIVTSDHAKDGEVIHAAYRMYADFGAEVELTVPDYHAPGEAKIVYGLDNPEFYAGQAPEPHSDTGLAITGAKHEPETDGTAGLVWEGRPEGIAGLADRLDRAHRDGARMAVPSLPSDISDARAWHRRRRVSCIADNQPITTHQDRRRCDGHAQSFGRRVNQPDLGQDIFGNIKLIAVVAIAGFVGYSIFFAADKAQMAGLGQVLDRTQYVLDTYQGYLGDNGVTEISGPETDNYSALPQR
ncbi:hypothetical protein JAN5088_00480 [Jannaschia rubra]|uniref:N-acetyltransferase domain-containing protein n=2 Tax=Jannaschia rubra TaxID=282197 RepID=A0A0M6XNE7_9RHOB|nr:hypothetical protein JAN5088_00480 [Jannaschia rubra]SFG55541.1 hypothetical protein SAMN04488517_106145 [Jannaschia rubra]